MSDRVCVPMEVAYKGVWLSWVAAATACLNALDVECDLWDVAGMTGYAFVMSVSPDLCPSGPTMFDWGMLDSGVHALGRSTMTFGTGDCHTNRFRNDRTQLHCREAFELTKREVGAGRPVVLWGAYKPEFAVAYGVDGDCYLVRSRKPDMGEEDTPIPFDAIDAPGGPYVMAFPTATDPRRYQRYNDYLAIRRAINLMHCSSQFQSHTTGISAYRTWIDGIEKSTANNFGLAYNSQCWAEAKSFASKFLIRLAVRNPMAAEPLNRAGACFSAAAQSLEKVAQLFPFPPQSDQVQVATRLEALDALEEAEYAEEQAITALADVAAIHWDLSEAS